MDKGLQSWVIVVGASGFVGSYVSAELNTDFNIIKTSRSKREGFTQFDMAKDSISSLLSKTSKRATGLSIVLCNKFGPMEDYILDEDFARECEVASVVKISNECKKLGIPIVYLSTSYVYPGDRSGYDEFSPVRPISLYGTLKREAELELLASSPVNLILRLDKVVGTSFENKHLFTEWYEAAKNGEKIRCIRGQNFSPTSVGDVALAVKLSLLNGLAGIYHCVNPEVWTRFDLAAYFVEKLELDVGVTSVSLEELGLSEERPLYSNLNSSKLMRILAFSFTPLSEIIEKLVEIKDSYDEG